MFKRLVLAFVLAVLLYGALWSFFEYLRVRKGPWEITFTAGPDGPPGLTVNQPALGISNLTILFEGAETAILETPKTVLFDQPNTLDLPFGEWIHLDLEFQPGVVTLEIFDHLVEFLPRTLIIDWEETPWRSNDIIVVRPRPEENTEKVVTETGALPSSEEQ